MYSCILHDKSIVKQHTTHLNVLPIALLGDSFGTIPIGLESPHKSDHLKTFWKKVAS